MTKITTSKITSKSTAKSTLVKSSFKIGTNMKKIRKRVTFKGIPNSNTNSFDVSSLRSAVLFRKNFIFCRNKMDILLSNEELEENDPICVDKRMTQVSIFYLFYFRLKYNKTGSWQKTFLEFNTNKEWIRIYTRGTKMG